MNHQIVYTPFSPHRFNLTQALGSHIWDDKGNKYIDFTSGWNVTNLGWNNKEIIEAGIAQFRKNTYVPMWASEDIQAAYAKDLLSSIGKEFDYVARATSGMEAVEMAIKTARIFTGKKKVLSFFGQYHGSSINGLSMSYQNEWMKNLSSNMRNFVKLEYPNTYRTNLSDQELLNKLEKDLETQLSTGKFACIVTESGIITGWGSTYTAPKDFIELIDKVCKKHKVLFVLDEVGTGFSRTGSLFAVHNHKISPDIIVLAKAISNGTQTIAAMISKKAIIEKSYKESNLQSTFGWNPIACAVAKKTLEIHMRDKIWEKAKRNEKIIKSFLSEALRHNSFVGDIRGAGMEIGLDLVKDKKTKEKNTKLLEKVIEKSFGNGLHLVSDHESNIQIMPPLTIDTVDLKKGLSILVKTIKSLTN